MTLKGGKNKIVAQKLLGFRFLSHFDIFCDLLLKRHTATGKQFILNNKEMKKLTVTSFMQLSSGQQIKDSEKSKCT